MIDPTISMRLDTQLEVYEKIEEAEHSITHESGPVTVHVCDFHCSCPPPYPALSARPSMSWRPGWASSKP